MTKDEAIQQALVALGEFGYHGSSPRWERAVNDLRTALEQPPLPVQEPTQWRDMVVVSLVREGINKHKARELADHFAAQPVQEPVGEVVEVNNDGFQCEFNQHLPVGTKLYTTPPLPVQEPLEYWNAVEGWVKIDEVREHFDAVGCGTIYKTAGEDRVPLYTAPPQQQAEPPPEWPLIKNILAVFGLDAISFVAKWQAAQQQAEPVAWDKPSDNFNEWWNGDYEDPANPFEKDSHGYWAWEGWQAALRSKNT